MISVSYQGKRLSYSVLRSVPNTLMLRICAVLLLSVLMLNDARAQVASQQATPQRSRGVELSEIARSRIAEQIATKRLEKQQGISAAKSNAAQQIAADIRSRLQSAVDVPYEEDYFDTQAGNDFSFPEDTHDFCRASFGSDTANKDYYLDATINAGESLVVTLNWTAPATFADYDLYLFDREGRPAGDPEGLFPNGTIGNNYQTDNSNLVEVASLTNEGVDEAVIAVIDRFRGEAGSMLSVTITGNDGAFSVLEFVGTDNLTYLNADVDGNGADLTVGPLTEGLVISSEVASSFNAQFNTDGCAESVVFTLTDANGNPVEDVEGNPIVSFTDDDAPYAAFGDAAGDFNALGLSPGTYLLTAESFSQDGGQGASGTALSVGFSVEGGATGPAVDNFTLIDAASDEPVAGYDPIQEGAVIDLVELFYLGFDINRFNIRANVTDTDGQIQSVTTNLDITRVSGVLEQVANSDAGGPYSVYGDDDVSDFLDAQLPFGAYALSGAPVTAEGTLAAASVNFTVIGPRIVNYTLIDADLNDPIADFDPIPQDTTITFAVLPAQNFNIRANTFDYDPPLIDVVHFIRSRDGAIITERTESYRPYAVFGDCNLSIGCTIDVDPPFASDDVKPNYSFWNNPMSGNHLLEGFAYDGNPNNADTELISVMPLNFTLIVSGNAQAGAAPPQTQLLPNFPNPFNPVTTIRFGVPDASPVRLVVYDMLGRAVKVLVDSELAEGFHEVSFDAGQLASGMYLYRLETPTSVIVRPMTLLK